MKKYRRKKVYNGIVVPILLSLFLTILLFYDNENRDCNVVISEICINNKTAIYDDLGRYNTGFVEVYNLSDNIECLDGYKIINQNGYEYLLPPVLLNPGDSMIFWGKPNEDNTSFYREDYYSPDLGFVLSDGDKIILSSPGGGILSNVKVRDIEDDYSVQLSTDDQNNYIIAKASPSELLSRDELLFYEDTKPLNKAPYASFQSGFYDEPFYVELFSTNENDKIFYTLDGTCPSSESTQYVAPILIEDRSSEKNIWSNIDGISLVDEYTPVYLVDKATVLKAISIDENGNISDIFTASYFVDFSGKYGYDGIPVMSITCSPDDLFSEERGIYVLGNVYNQCAEKYSQIPFNEYECPANYLCSGIGWERNAQIEFFDESHNLKLIQDIGIRMHGNYSRAFSQKGFSLYARKEYGEDEFVYDMLENGKKYDKLMLRQADHYYTRIRDALIYPLIEDRSVGSQDSKPCIVFLNGEYWGHYQLQEKISECYISNEYGIATDDLVYMKTKLRKPSWNVNGNEAILMQKEWESFLSDALSKDLSDDSQYQDVISKIDIENFIEYCCIETYIGNYDWWVNNTAFWRSTKIYKDNEYGDGRWRWLLFDLDGCSGLVEPIDFDAIELGRSINPLFNALTRNLSFRKQFVITFMDIANNNFRYDTVHDRLMTLAGQQKKCVVANHMRWRGDFVDNDHAMDYLADTETEFDMNIDIIDNFYKERFTYATQHLKKNFDLTGDLIDVYLDAENKCDVRINSIYLDDFSGTWEGSYFSDYPIVLSCSFKDDNVFDGWFINGKLISTEDSITLDLEEYPNGVNISIMSKDK